MTAAAARASPAARPSALAVFIARAEARAILWAAGEISLHDAVDQLWADAVRDGLVAKLGPDEVQRLLADAFAPQRDDLPHDVDVVPDPARDETQAADGEVPKATLEAAEHLHWLGDLSRFQKWFDTHNAEQRAAILKHLEARKRKQG
jgi:hypothetical protein